MLGFHPFFFFGVQFRIKPLENSSVFILNGDFDHHAFSLLFVVDVLLVCLFACCLISCSVRSLFCRCLSVCRCCVLCSFLVTKPMFIGECLSVVHYHLYLYVVLLFDDDLTMKCCRHFAV